MDEIIVTFVDTFFITSKNGANSTLALFHALKLLLDTLALLINHQVVDGS